MTILTQREHANCEIICVNTTLILGAPDVTGRDIPRTARSQNYGFSIFSPIFSFLTWQMFYEPSLSALFFFPLFATAHGNTIGHVPLTVLPNKFKVVFLRNLLEETKKSSSLYLRYSHPSLFSVLRISFSQ